MYRYRAIVRRVIDADTIDCQVDLGFRLYANERFRLAGVDAWEVRGPERLDGLAAKKFVEDILPIGAEVILDTEKEPGSFGRWIATVTIDGTNLSDLLVEKGHAEYKEY